MPSTFRPASDPSLFAFVMIVFGVCGAVLVGMYVAADRAEKPSAPAAARVAGGLIAWLVAVSWVVDSGVLTERPMPRIPLFFAVLNLAGVAFALSSSGALLARHLPVGALIAFQAFRLPLELVLHEWAAQGTIPSTMTWSGSNLDVITGVLALPCALLARFRLICWLFNLVGFALLINVMRVAMFSSPLPFGWEVTPPLQLALHLPYAWIGAVCVAGALAGHIVLTRALMTDRRHAG